MKTKIAVALSSLIVASVRADMANYEATVAGQSPAYLFNFDNSLSANIGTGSFTANSGTAFTSDLSGTANYALSSTGANAAANNDYISTATIVNGQGTTTSIGTLSFLFNISTVTGSEYFLSVGGDVTSDNNALALAVSGGTPEFKLGNHSIVLPTLTTGEWYYFAATWNFDGVAANNTATYYIGALGGSLTSATVGSGTFTAAAEVGGTTGETGSSGEVVIGNRQANNSSMQGDYDELATWNSPLSSSQITGQFNALTTPLPEPSAGMLISAGVVLLELLRRKLS
jgi:hypothetical protein